MAAVIAAGLHGVEKGLKLGAPITGTNQGAEHIPRAPRTLIETTRIFQKSADRARLAGRYFRRPLRRHARVGMAPVAGRRDRLGNETLF
jgi:glutamine synthetase